MNRAEITRHDGHIPVMMSEAMQSLESVHDGVVIDCTFGRGGMSRALLQEKPNIRVIGIDRDGDAVQSARGMMDEFGTRLQLVRDRFSSAVRNILESSRHGRLGKCHSDEESEVISRRNAISALIADVGVSSPQLDDVNRGFSFRSHSLDMRMDRRQSTTARHILHGYSRPELERIFKEYGEIRGYKKLASMIISAREKGEITPSVLNGICDRIKSKKSINSATLAYQALRIEVNEELYELNALMESLQDHSDIMRGAIVVMISFHSIEDRIVKNHFRKWTQRCICSQQVMKCTCGGDNAIGEMMYKKPLRARIEEIRLNPRARSAKLRAFRFYGD